VNSLGIVIVNWNSGFQLRECLNSILLCNKDGYELSQVVAVDNNSSDGSADGWEFEGLPILVIKNDKNKGFGAACNQGALHCDADYLLFLNPDTKLFSNSLSSALTFMDRKENSNIGVCGIQLVDEKGIISRHCTRFPTLLHFVSKILGLNQILPSVFPTHVMNEWPHASNRDVDHVIGAYYLIRRHIFNEIHGFDERFFMYLEDLDMSLRVKQHGWRIFYLAETQAFHRGGGTSRAVIATRLYYSLISRIRYTHKHFSYLGCFIHDCLTFLVEPWTRLVFALIKGPRSKIWEIVQAYKMLAKSTWLEHNYKDSSTP